MSTGYGWDLRTSGPADAQQTVLLLPGGMCTAEAYDEVVGHEALRDVQARFVAVTQPGFGNVRPSPEPSWDDVVRRTGELAAEVGAGVVVGHSMGANVALELAAGGLFTGPVVLLEPSLSRVDEFKELSVLDRIGRLPGLGGAVWWVGVRTIGMAMKEEMTPEQHAVLAPLMARCDPRFCRRLVHSYFAYLDHHGSVASRLCESGVSAVVVYGDRSKVGLTDDERAALEACAAVQLVRFEDCGHMVMANQPSRTAELIRDVVVAPRRVAT